MIQERNGWIIDYLFTTATEKGRYRSRFKSKQHDVISLTTFVRLPYLFLIHLDVTNQSLKKNENNIGEMLENPNVQICDNCDMLLKMILGIYVYVN